MNKYVFLLGAPDDRRAAISGFDADKKVVYGWDGHTEFYTYLNVPAAQKEFWYILPFVKDSFNISVPEIVINCIANPDLIRESLGMTVTVLNGVRKNWPKVRVFNPPEGIMKTTRDRIYADFHPLPGLEIPQTVRCKPARVRDLTACAADHGFTRPYMVRHGGAHRGDRLVLMEKAEDADTLERFAFDGSDYYITQFRDYKNADGHYVKVRLVMMGDAIYPRHAIISDQWAVHAKSRGFMTGRADLKKQEEKILATWRDMISPDALRSLQSIPKSLGLDYVGVDGCILPDGRLLVFEINASQSAMAPSNYVEFPYLRQYVTAIIDGFNQLILPPAEDRAHA